MKKPIRFVLFSLMGAALLLVSSGGACRQQNAMPPEAAEMTLEWARLFDQGEVKEIEISTQNDTIIVSTLKNLVAKSTGVLRLALTPDRVQSYRNQGQGLELALARADSFPYANGARSIKPTRLFVIWNGDLVGENSEDLVVLYGYPEYSAGPLKIMDGRSKFLNFVAELPRKKAGSN